MSYISENFLLDNAAARKLYFDYAKNMPIFDYHCHLSEKEILQNKPFEDLFEIWLSGDHYKWRMMRNAGVSERLITGDASHEEKFRAYCKALGTAFGNPLYHWSQVELETYFGCTLEINEKNADAIWAQCNRYIREHSVTPQSLMEGSGVACVFTTNEAFDDLSVFEKIKEKHYAFQVAPAFRTDKFLHIEAPGFIGFVEKLAAAAEGPIKNLDDLLAALEQRLDAFIRVGCKASDLGLEYICKPASKETAAAVFAAKLGGVEPTQAETDLYKGYMTYALLKLYGQKGIRSELHFGVTRNKNSRMFRSVGPDTGFDSISEKESTGALAELFDKLDSENCLPCVILFNLNPKMNMELCSLIGDFQTDEAKGKMQYGPAWWFLDQKEGIEKQLKDLAAVGHLGSFIGMLTDSRSFLSYPRHHYFRRILCNYLGTMMEQGQLTGDYETVGEVVRDISFRNAAAYFGI